MTIRSYETLPNFPCFITYLAACMHAFCMFYLYVSLGCLLKLVKVNKQVFAITLWSRNLNHTAQQSISATGGNNNFVSRAGGGGRNGKDPKIQGFFRKNPSIFPQKPKFWTFGEFLLFQSHSTANLLQFSEIKFAFRNVNEHRFGVNAIGKHRVKKNVRNSAFERMISLPYFKYGAKY